MIIYLSAAGGLSEAGHGPTISPSPSLVAGHVRITSDARPYVSLSAALNV